MIVALVALWLLVVERDRSSGLGSDFEGGDGGAVEGPELLWLFAEGPGGLLVLMRAVG